MTNMKRFILYILLSIGVILSTCNFATAQSRTNRIYRPCPASTTSAAVSISVMGAITLSPCSGQTVSLPSGSTIGGLTSGSVLFAGVNGSVAQNNTSFLWDNSKNELRLNATLVLRDGSQAGGDGVTMSYDNATNDFLVYDSAQGDLFSFGQNGALQVRDSARIGWTSSSSVTGTLDTTLARFSAGVVRLQDNLQNTKALIGGGANVSSAAALPLPTGRVFHVTGTTSITSITSTNFASGVCITLIFDNALTFTDGGNLRLAGNFVTTADDTISLCYDGTNWFETGRSVN
jgi:hypothetical protein